MRSPIQTVGREAVQVMTPSTVPSAGVVAPSD
jgi:hypothetical protein